MYKPTKKLPEYRTIHVQAERYKQSFNIPFVNTTFQKLYKEVKQAIESGINLATDALRGNNMKESANNEFTSFKNTAADTLETLKRKRKNQEGYGVLINKKMKKNQVKKKRNIRIKRVKDFLG